MQIVCETLSLKNPLQKSTSKKKKRKKKRGMKKIADDDKCTLINSCDDYMK
jgi:hypothetical protein